MVYRLSETADCASETGRHQQNLPERGGPRFFPAGGAWQGISAGNRFRAAQPILRPLAWALRPALQRDYD